VSGVALRLFSTREAYGALTGDVEQNGWYQELLDLLDAPPAFTDLELRWRADEGKGWADCPHPGRAIPRI
jgi:hypothetical protein